mmetsp:Transcript_77619/g.251333  ORF Transcript_77619/g.251333 Transcript_77619/m.251333 type:complete len:214 (+) Transcript_77619:1034-1675(+)
MEENRELAISAATSGRSSQSFATCTALKLTSLEHAQTKRRCCSCVTKDRNMLRMRGKRRAETWVRAFLKRLAISTPSFSQADESTVDGTSILSLGIPPRDDRNGAESLLSCRVGVRARQSCRDACELPPMAEVPTFASDAPIELPNLPCHALGRRPCGPRADSGIDCVSNDPSAPLPLMPAAAAAAAAAAADCAFVRAVWAAAAVLAALESGG